MTKEELEQSIYARTRSFVGHDVLDAVLDLLAASRRAAFEEAARAAELESAGFDPSDPFNRGYVKACFDSAIAIRALSQQPAKGE